MLNQFVKSKNVEVTNLFTINYTLLMPLQSNSNTFFELYNKLKAQNKHYIFFKSYSIYIITNIQLNQNNTPITPNPIFKINVQKLLSLHTKNSNLLYLNKEEKFSYFTPNNKLQIIKIKNIKLI